MFLEKTSEAAFAVTTLKRAGANSNLPPGQDEDFLTTAIASAEDYIERYLECCIGMTSFRLTLDNFPQNRGSIVVPMWPVRSVTEIAYQDINGVSQTIPLEQIVQPVGNGRYPLRLNNVSWPSTNGTLNGISIEFTAGWQTQRLLPATLVRAALMLISHWNENREAVIVGSASKEVEFGVQSMLDLLREEDE